MQSTAISLNKLPELGSRAHLYGYGYFYKASARLFTSLAKLLRESKASGRHLRKFLLSVRFFISLKETFPGSL